MRKSVHLLTVVLAAGFCVTAQAQAPAPAAPQAPPPDIELTKFRLEQVAAAGGIKPWLRLLADFGCRPDWADGIAFYYDVLVQQGDKARVLSGTARYSNVKRGRHAAVLYMSPSAAERFGTPVAAVVRASYKDEQSSEIKWEAEGKSAPDGWEKQFQRYPNQLMPIVLTPFVATEYGKYPDALVPQ
jgi:hypothetical protein